LTNLFYSQKDEREILICERTGDPNLRNVHGAHYETHSYISVNLIQPASLDLILRRPDDGHVMAETCSLTHNKA